MRRYIVSLMTLALLLGCLSGCGGAAPAPGTETPAVSAAPEETAPPAATEAPEETEEPVSNPRPGYSSFAPDTPVATADGTAIDWETYYGALLREVNVIYAYYGAVDLSISYGEETLGDVLREEAEYSLLQAAMLYRRAGEAGLALTEEDVAKIDEEIDYYAVMYYGGDREALFAQSGLTEAYYRLQAGASILYDKLYTEYFGENGADLPVADCAAWLEDNGYLHAKHILLMTVDSVTREPLDEEAVAAKRAQAEEIYATLKATDPEALPETFDTMMHDYSEDTGLAVYPDGYFFQEGTMVDEFYQAALALEEGQLSEIVESVYGYHILYRPVLDPDAIFDYDSDYDPYLLRDQVAGALLENILTEWLEEAQFEYETAFEPVDVAELFAAE